MSVVVCACGRPIHNLPPYADKVRWQCAKCRDRVQMKTPLDWRERLTAVCRGQKVRRVG